ncbi:MAG: SHOCT domain-containing protein [Chloroflexi bacterium]|nr:SHOCT domain-containing protein [Chloroflexota bacterium]
MHSNSAVGWGWMALGWVWMLLFWGSIIGLVVWGISRLSGGRREDGPLEIAKRRYARGEITREQFEALKRDIA